MQAIYIGFDPKEADAFAVARSSIRRRLTQPIPIYGLSLPRLRDAGLYWREHERRDDGRMYDVISDAPISTEFANSRFLVPHLAKHGWSLFLDADMLVLENLVRLFELADPRYAVMVVKHQHVPFAEWTKMDGQRQTVYHRKNWSSLMLINNDHPSNRRLTVEMVNTLPGRDLHRFCWLNDEEIGELEPRWNWLVGYSDPEVAPSIVHFTSGGPWLEEYKDVSFASTWRDERDVWLRAA